MRLLWGDLSLGCVFSFVRGFKSAELLSREIGLGRDREGAESVRRTHADTFVFMHVCAPRGGDRRREKEQEAPPENHTCRKVTPNTH